MSIFGKLYPPGAEHDPRAPWNQPESCEACDGCGYVGGEDNERDCPNCCGTGYKKTKAQKRAEYLEDREDDLD